MIKFNNVIHQYKSSHKLLGVTFYIKHKHILSATNTTICNNFFRSNGIMIPAKQLKSVLPNYYSLIYPYISYCNLFRKVPMYDIHFACPKILQKRAIHIVTSMPRLDITTFYFLMLDILFLNPYTNPRHYSVDIFLGVNEPRPQICICEFMCINEPLTL